VGFADGRVTRPAGFNCDVDIDPEPNQLRRLLTDS
jgi:hypothetical protein